MAVFDDEKNTMLHLPKRTRGTQTMKTSYIKMTLTAAAKVLPAAALVLLGSCAVPSAKAQGIGDILDKANETVNKAKDEADKATGGHKKSSKDNEDSSTPSTDSADRKGGAQSKGGGQSKDGADSSADSSTQNALDVANYSGPSSISVEKQITASLRKIAPKGIRLLVVSCKPGVDPSKPYSYTSACLVGPTGKMHATSVPAIPASVNAQFAVLRNATQHEGNGMKLWEVCKVTIPFGLTQTFGDENDGIFGYGYKEYSGDPDNDNVYKMVTPTQLLAKFQKVSVRVDRDAKVSAANRAKQDRLDREADAYDKSHGIVVREWKCENCGETYSSKLRPGLFTPDDCPNDPAGPPFQRHHWVLNK